MDTHCYLVYVAKSGEAIPIAIHDREYQEFRGNREWKDGTLVSIIAESIYDAVEKAKGEKHVG